MLNSKNLDTISNYFRSIAIVSQSRYNNTLCQVEIQNLQTAIKTRPECAEIEKTVEKTFITIEKENNENEDNENETNENQTSMFNIKDLNEKTIKSANLKEKKQNIKINSPFTTIFNKIGDQVSHDIRFDNTLGEENQLYSPDLMTFLLDKFMPYCFIWSSFSLTDLSFSRLTNGVIEKYNQFCKRSVPKNILPHGYVKEKYLVTRGIIYKI